MISGSEFPYQIYPNFESENVFGRGEDKKGATDVLAKFHERS